MTALLIVLLILFAFLAIFVGAAIYTVAYIAAEDNKTQMECQDCDHWEGRIWKGYCYQKEKKCDPYDKCCECFKMREEDRILRK